MIPRSNVFEAPEIFVNIFDTYPPVHDSATAIDNSFFINCLITFSNLEKFSISFHSLSY